MAILFALSYSLFPHYQSLGRARLQLQFADLTVVFDIDGIPATLVICRDGRHPELYRLPAMAGAKIFWSRGNGWLVCAAVDLLELVPDHRDAGFVREVGVAALKAMATYQDASGYFCHVLDDPRSNLEASGGLMFAYAVAKAARLGLDVEELVPAALRALSAVAGGVEPSGKVPGVAVPPGGPGVPFDWAPFGQGFFLLAAGELAGRLEA